MTAQANTVPKTWSKTHWGVLECYVSPSQQEWIRLNYRGEWDWYYHGATGTCEFVSQCLTMMAGLGFLEGEFE